MHINSQNNKSGSPFSSSLGCASAQPARIERAPSRAQILVSRISGGISFSREGCISAGEIFLGNTLILPLLASRQIYDTLGTVPKTRVENVAARAAMPLDGSRRPRFPSRMHLIVGERDAREVGVKESEGIDTRILSRLDSAWRLCVSRCIAARLSRGFIRGHAEGVLVNAGTGKGRVNTASHAADNAAANRSQGSCRACRESPAR